MSDEFDLVVIGGGSGGVRAARMSAQFGAKVAIVEEYRYGGTCVIRGCVPKKLFVYASRFNGLFDIAPTFGWQVDAKFDWPTLLANKNKEIARLESIYEKLLDTAGVTVFHDRAVLKGADTVALQSGKTLKAKHILVATGGAPFKPQIEGAELGITSNEAFHLETLPRTILIEGGGYIAVEFATIFAGLGVDTTLVYRRDKILRGFDHDLRDGLEDEMRSRGIRFRYGYHIAGLCKDGEGVCVSFSHGEEATFDKVMFATGRHPNTDGMGLEEAGVELDQSGAIVVDEYSRSSVPSIYAVGDVTARAALTPVAIREGAAFAQTVFNHAPTVVPYDLIPTAVFSEPEIGTVGLPEHVAAERYHSIDVYVTRFRPMQNTLSDRTEKMMLKLITETASGKVIGCHIFGPGAGEMIQLVAIPMGMGATKADFDRAIAVHPTAAEELVTLKAPSYRIIDGEKTGV
ncbi:glutathione-disulfide reductase [Pelagibacterium xiamenense]|uniref:glutathione-disulfide reductase n=1 Tax=Pelagibacterium xiamenense TaxID=2901140 RepID=UPI001E388BCE|nr:glutathione-disulfide reductase [Pelagibacterium xiamenense]MCD7059602.1 glutathione-disulfide reductase [Pelagibacterium xiamenense]